VQVVDLRNGGAHPGGHLHHVVVDEAGEGAGGPVPLPQAPLAPELLGLVQHVAAYERLAARAAAEDDRELAAKALLAHPLVGQWPANSQLLDMLTGERTGARP